MGITMRTLALILLSSLLCCCYAQSFNPPKGQRCRGRNYDGKRCCTPEQPCGLGEGDCDGPLDGGVNDGHRGCQGNLVCGSNNCKKFGDYYHPKDDCCDLPQNLPRPKAPVIVPGTPLTPPAGQRCRGRNYDGRRCCTPENPCGEGEGDCDGPGDGASMTVTEAAGRDWCAGVTTVRSSALTTTRKMTAVRDQLEDLEDLEDIHPIHHQTGVPGVLGPAWLLELSVENRSAGNSSAVSLTAE